MQGALEAMIIITKGANLVELRCPQYKGEATRTVREAPLQQSLAGNKCYRAGERITEPDRQGEEGRAGNNRQSKKRKRKKSHK